MIMLLIVLLQTWTPGLPPGYHPYHPNNSRAPKHFWIRKEAKGVHKTVLPTRQFREDEYKARIMRGQKNIPPPNQMTNEALFPRKKKKKP